MTPLHRLALRVSRHTAADSSHEQLLWWWLHVFSWRWWYLRRQVAVGIYHLDIAVTDVKLAIEIDGEYWHLRNDQPMRDAYRTKYLIEQGWTVIRFTDKEVELAPAAASWYAGRIVRAMRKRTLKNL
jgi:very-short-patch-repair endonuclease